MDEEELLEEIRRGDEDRAKSVPLAREPTQAPGRRSSSGGGSSATTWIKLGVVFGLLGAGVAFLLSGTGASEAFVYSKPVAEVMASPDEFVGRELRVEGRMKSGSIRFQPEPTCEHHFVLTGGEHELAVTFPRCVVPDTFRDDMPVDVVVQGHLQSDHTFLANEVLPRCPSKYEQREANGETSPYRQTPAVPAP